MVANSFVFGVVNGTADEPRLRHLTEPQPVTLELLELAAPVRPTEVFRFAAPCAGVLPLRWNEVSTGWQNRKASTARDRRSPAVPLATKLSLVVTGKGKPHAFAALRW